MSGPERGDVAEASPLIIAFYGCTGGLACTTTVANVGWILASAGKRVLLVDWNLDDPKLHRFFTPFIPSDEIVAGADGAVDMVLGFWQDVEAHRSPGAGTHDVADRHIDLRDRVIALGWSDVPDVPAGRLDFLGSGRRDADYDEKVARYVREDVESGAPAKDLFFALRASLLDSDYDYVLIDSRTGSRLATQACTTQLADMVVVCFSLTRDGIDLATTAARQLQSNAAPSTRILPVATRVDSDAGPALDQVRDYAYQQFGDVLGEPDAEAYQRYWAHAELPYRSYAAQDVLAPFIERAGHPATLLSAYERFTGLLTGGAVSRLAPVLEEHRPRIAERFGHEARRQGGSVAVVGDPKDRAWLDWVRAQLEWAGINVVVPGNGDALGPEIPDTATTLVLISPNLERSPIAAALSKRIYGRDQMARWDDMALVAVRIHERSVPDAFRLMPQINLVLLDEMAARRQLLTFLRGQIVTSGPGEGPTGGPRFPKDVPRLLNLPARNHYFTGREDTLQAMRDALGTDVRQKPALPVTGTPCVGKSSIALEYAWRFQADYDIVWWIRASDSDTVKARLCDLAEQVGVSPGPRMVEMLFDAMRTDQPLQRCLLIYDDAGPPGDLEGLIPAWCHAIITSFHRGWEAEPLALSVGAFRPEESVALLKRRTPIPDMQAAAVADGMGHMPLCLDQAGAVLSSRLDLGGADPVAELFQSLDEEARATGVARQPDSAGVRLTTAVAINEMSAHYRAAGQLLKLCAYLSPDGIGLDLVRSSTMTEELGNHDPDFARNHVQLPQVLHQITRFSLVKRDSQADTLTMNPLLQRLIRERMSEQDQAACRQSVHRVLAAYSPPDTEMDETKHDQVYRELAAHVLPSGAPESEVAEVRRWLVNQVRYFYRTARLDEAHTLGRELYDAWTEQYGERDELRLRMGTQLANACRALGHYGEAYGLIQHVLDIQMDVHGPDHRFTLMTQRGLGADLHARGDFQDGLAMDETTYHSYRNDVGEEHPNTLLAGLALARALLRTGAWDEARNYAEDTFAIRRRVMEDHVLTWVTGVQVGTTARLAGEPEYALRVLRLCHEQLVRITGETSGRVYDAVVQLAAIHRHLGRPEPALVEARRAHEGCHELYGRRHPSTMVSATELAACSAAVGNPEDALRHAAEARRTCVEVFGEYHPYVSIIQANEAAYALACERVEDAAQLAHQAWVTLTEHPAMGPKHPATLTATLTYAATLVAQGDLPRADELETEVYQGFRTMFGDHHPYAELAFGNRNDTIQRKDGTTDPAHGTGLRRHIDGEVIPI